MKAQFPYYQWSMTGHPPGRGMGPTAAAAAVAAVVGSAAWAANVSKQVLVAPAGAV